MEKFSQEEHEANGHTPHHLIAQSKAQRAHRLMQIIERENLSELEPEHIPIYTHYIGPIEVLHNFGF